MGISNKKIKEIKKNYKEWCGMELELSEYTFDSISSQVKFTKQLMIDEAENEADSIINALYRVEVKLP